jgi:dihydrofolate synthase/folylpolyglutamate synthase
MNYSEVIDYLYNSTPMFQKVGSTAYKEGLENTFLLDSRFGHPHRNYRTIHVGGTNGKGSASHLLASVLQHSGYKTGLYTSPHLTDFRERIRINGVMIPEDFIINYINGNFDFFEEIHPSFFEVTTALAFLYFSSQEVDASVIEVGLGGRLDCTNIISPDLSVITNISFDHTALLGNTLKLIAQEKAGIIKSKTPVIIGETTAETKAVFIHKTLEVDAPIIFAEDETLINSSHILPSGRWEFDAKEYPGLTGELGGLSQEKNALTVLCAIKELKKLGYVIPDEAVYKGFSSVVETTGLSGRWQIIPSKPKIILDAGHNIAGIEYIVRQLAQETYDTLRIIIGMVNDKDIDSVLSLLPKQANYYFTKASIPRALDEKILMQKAQVFGLQGNSYPTVVEAINSAKEYSFPNDRIFIGGSTFIVADALAGLNMSGVTTYP